MSRGFGPEDIVHVQAMEWIRRVRPDAIVFHVPNGGHRTQATALKMKRLGVRPGVADLEVVIPGHPTLYLEVKAKGGYPSPEQRQFGADMIARGRIWAVVRSIDDVRAVFSENDIAFVEAEDLRLPLDVVPTTSVTPSRRARAKAEASAGVVTDGDGMKFKTPSRWRSRAS